jgi:hypothetical protein
VGSDANNCYNVAGYFVVVTKRLPLKYPSFGKKTGQQFDELFDR